MIAIARNILPSLCLNPNSFLRNSNVGLFSTSRNKRLIIPSPEIYNLLVNKHQFPPGLASLAALRLAKFRNRERADSVLSFLKENSFTTAQLQKTVVYNPRILGFTVEGLKSRFKLFQDLGLSPEEIAKIISSDRSVINSSMVNRIIPSLSMLKGLLGSDHDVAKLVRRCTWLLTSDLEKTLMPNVEILKSCSIPMKRILHFLYVQPRCFLVKPDIMRKSVDRAIEIGVSQTAVLFIQALAVISSMSEGMWEVKMQTLRDLGFSNDDIFTMFRKAPIGLLATGKKLKNVFELLHATGRYNISSIVTCPLAFQFSIEKRIEPRMQILRLLESRNLIEKWPPLSSALVYTDDRFFDRFIRPYYDEIHEEHIIKIYVEGRKR